MSIFHTLKTPRRLASPMNNTKRTKPMIYYAKSDITKVFHCLTKFGGACLLSKDRDLWISNSKIYHRRLPTFKIQILWRVNESYLRIGSDDKYRQGHFCPFTSIFSTVNRDLCETVSFVDTRYAPSTRKCWKINSTTFDTSRRSHKYKKYMDATRKY